MESETRMVVEHYTRNNLMEHIAYVLASAGAGLDPDYLTIAALCELNHGTVDGLQRLKSKPNLPKYHEAATFLMPVVI